MNLLFLATYLPTVGLLVLAVGFFLKREGEWRTRERKLVDELLRLAHVPALEVRQERIAKIPDAETTPLLNDIDQAMYEDDLLEDLENIHGLGRGMSPTDARLLFPAEWAEVKRNYDEARKPLKVA